MPRRPRVATGGYVYHVLNRAVGRATLFRKDGDYAAFEAILRQAPDFRPMRLLAYCLMPNHWHLVLWPKGDGDLSEYVRWLTVTHTQRRHAHYHSAGTGPVYQGRFKSFPIQVGDHLRTVLRYVERNALWAGLVRKAEAWRWSSLWQRLHGDAAAWLGPWPEGRPDPSRWVKYVNGVETAAELAALHRSVARGSPYGDGPWAERTAARLGLESSLRPRGRPPKERSTEE
jgi:REP-associated tyrosine transposase